MAHRGQLDEAKPVLEGAVRLEPKLGTAHEAMGYYLYRRQEFEKADGEIREAIADGDLSFDAAYMHGMLLERSGPSSQNNEALDSLKKATQLNPNFAPAFDMLAYVYSQSPDQQKPALDACLTAVKLDPAQHRYVFHVANLLMSNGRDADARRLSERIVATANSPEEKAEAEALLIRIRQHEQWVAARKERQEASIGGAQAASTGSVDVTDTNAGTPQKPAAMPLSSKTTMAIEGTIDNVNCAHLPELTMKVNFSGSLIALHSANLATTQILAAKGQTAMASESCKNWAGRKVKVWVHPNQGQDNFGEITRIFFY